MKMAKLMLIVLIALLLVSISYAGTVVTPANNSQSSAESGKSAALQHKPGMKAERGVKNILFGWTEIPKSVIQVTRDTKNPIWGLLGGTFKGVGKAFPRTVSGIADVVSFPIGDYDKMPVKPDEINTQVQ
jgi:putative exosortase-associated protein (TIGR04073 family)